MEYTFRLGNTVVTTHNINELREYVEEIQSKIAPGEAYCKYISDFCYDVEVIYQVHHGLGPDNFELVHK